MGAALQFGQIRSEWCFMRSVTNAILLLVALLSVLGIYVLREHPYRGSQKRFAQQFGSETLKVANRDTSYQKRAVRSVHRDGSGARNVSPPVAPRKPSLSDGSPHSLERVSYGKLPAACELER